MEFMKHRLFPQAPIKVFFFFNLETILPSSQPLIEMKMFYINAFA